jgi:hypothetical protein
MLVRAFPASFLLAALCVAKWREVTMSLHIHIDGWENHLFGKWLSAEETSLFGVPAGV